MCPCAYQQDVKRLATIKQQLESYKRQTLELQNRLTDETKRADKWEFEFNRIQEKFAIQQREKEVGLVSTALVIVVCHTSEREVGLASTALVIVVCHTSEREVGLASTALVIVVCHAAEREGGRTG